MNLEKRLDMIRKKSEDIKKENEIEIKRIREEQANLLRQIRELQPRIAELIIVANSCIDNGFEFPESTRQYGYGYQTGSSYNFIADGIYHHVGFMDIKKGCWRKGELKYRKAEYIGIINGGFCGQWDFYINGNDHFVQHQETKQLKPISSVCSSQLNDFIKEFDLFEQAFYKWIDDYCQIKGDN